MCSVQRTPVPQRSVVHCWCMDMHGITLDIILWCIIHLLRKEIPCLQSPQPQVTIVCVCVLPNAKGLVRCYRCLQYKLCIHCLEESQRKSFVLGRRRKWRRMLPLRLPRSCLVAFFWRSFAVLPTLSHPASVAQWGGRGANRLRTSTMFSRFASIVGPEVTFPAIA